MRFESKHGYFKSCSKGSRNFKNICRTLAFRHQEYVAYVSAGRLLKPDLIYLHGNSLSFDLIGEEMSSVLFENGVTQQNCIQVQTASEFGISYSTFMLVV